MSSRFSAIRPPRNLALRWRGSAGSLDREPGGRPLGALLIALLGSGLAIGAAPLAEQSRGSGGESSASQSTLVAGRRVFVTECAPCHGLDARGGEHAPNILVMPEVRRMSNADVSRVIRQGVESKGMPAFGHDLNASEIGHVAAYLLSLIPASRESAHLPGDPAAGKALFFGKAGCADCHMINGEGGFLGADLSMYGASHGVDDTRDAIRNPNKSPEGREKTVAVVTRSGERFTGVARNEDNFSLQLQTQDGAFHLLSKSDLEHIDYLRQSLMPADYAQRLDARELNDLISFLMRTASVNSNRQAGAAIPNGTGGGR
jgi:cytochrome c oxidase cbb3-type subunit III